MRILLHLPVVLILLQIGCASTPDVVPEPVQQVTQVPQETHPLVAKIANILQDGWDVKQSGNIILVTRREPVSTYGNVATPPRGPWLRRAMSESKRNLNYQISIEIGDRKSKSDYQKMIEVNSRTELDLDIFEDKMREFRSKADFSPQSESERKLYEDYRRMLRELPYDKVPDLYDDQHSFYVTTSRHSRESFVYPPEGRECRAVLENIFSFAEGYSDFNDKTDDEEHFEYPFDHTVEKVFLSRRDYDSYLLVKQDNLPELRVKIP